MPAPTTTTSAEMFSLRGGYLMASAFWFQQLPADRPGTCAGAGGGVRTGWAALGERRPAGDGTLPTRSPKTAACWARKQGLRRPWCAKFEPLPRLCA